MQLLDSSSSGEYEFHRIQTDKQKIQFNCNFKKRLVQIVKVQLLRLNVFICNC
jgi:hypothetical protein